MGVATESAKVFSCTCFIPIVYLYCTDTRRPPLEGVIAGDDLNYVDPQLRGRQGYRLWYLKCRNRRGRAVCKELDDGTRTEFRITVPHICGSEEIDIQAKRVEDAIVKEASDPAATLPLRSIHERHVENLLAEVRAKVRTTLQLKSKVSRRRKKQRMARFQGAAHNELIHPEDLQDFEGEEANNDLPSSESGDNSVGEDV